MSIGPDLRDVYLELGRWVAMLLEKPADDLPEPAVKEFVCTVNSTTAFKLFNSGGINRTELAAIMRAAGEVVQSP
jgi:hypothetical protein